MKNIIRKIILVTIISIVCICPLDTNALDDYQIAIQADNFTNLDKIGEKID